jgi:hypothetical protein
VYTIKFSSLKCVGSNFQVNIDCELARKNSTHRVTEADSYGLYPWPCLDCGINPVTQQVESTMAQSSLGR